MRSPQHGLIVKGAGGQSRNFFVFVVCFSFGLINSKATTQEMSKTQIRGAVACQAFVVIVAMCASMALGSASHNQNLYPRCATSEVGAQASGGQTVSLQKLSINPSELIIACIAADVAPIGGLPSEQECAIAHQTDFAYRLFITATYADPNTNGQQTVEYELKDVMGGSANRLHIRLPAPGTFELKFSNLAPSSNCVLKARAMLEVEQGTSTPSSTPAPVLVSVKPNVLHTEGTTYAYFMFRHIRSSLGSSGDSACLIENSRQCADLTSANTALPLAFVAPTDPSFARETAGVADAQTLSVRKYFFDLTGTFRVCYALAQSQQWEEIAMLSVYNGNPSYYTFEGGQGPQGQIYTNHKITIRFHGFGLDTRPDGDQAKFVEDGSSCTLGDPAGGVSVATDLGPADDWGPNTKYTEWSWTLLTVGSYKVCYKRKDHAWVEVPSLAEIGPGAIDFTSPPQGPVPTPTDPITHDDCPMAPTGADNPNAYTSTILKLELTTSKVPSSYLTALSQALCLPESAISIPRQKATDHGMQLWLDFRCDAKGANDKVPCNAQERKNYAVHLSETNSPIAKSLSWKRATQTSQDDIFAEADDHGAFGGLLANKNSRRAFFIGCLTLIVVVCVAVYGVLKYKEKQHYFIQFGVDDDEVDADGVDELEIDEHGDIGRRKKTQADASYVPNATIELED